MWIPFFKNEKEAVGDCPSIHRETTQKIISKPNIALLEEHCLLCSNCNEEIDFTGVDSLSLADCPYCNYPNFVPMKVKNYWLYEPLGGGGMGSVYHALATNIKDLELAIKILPRKRKNEEFLIDALMKEAKIGKEFGDHPHLAKIYDMGHCNGEYFEALEYVDGIRLDQVIDSPVQRSEKQIMLWAMQILSAEQHMCDCGYLFRDLKPQNIIIDNSGNVKLIDYGLALSLEEALHNDSDNIQGSPFYLPPERIIGSGESLCSEIYSLGMVIFHVIAREPYYSQTDLRRLVGKHVKQLRINNIASKLPAETDPELVEVLHKMIDRTPSERYQTYKEAGAAIFKIYKKSA